MIKWSGRRLQKLFSTVLDVSRIRTRIEAKFAPTAFICCFASLFFSTLFFSGGGGGGGGVCLICHKIAARLLVRKLPGMIWIHNLQSQRSYCFGHHNA